MRLACGAVLALVLTTGIAKAFENIEADAFYEGPVKAETLKEFEVGLVLLKTQAENLGMQVREKDINSLTSHMYGKALLKAECFDKAITLQKSSSKKINIAANVKSCVDLYLNYKPSAARIANPRRLFCEATLPRWTNENRPYPFLELNSGSRTPNYIGIRTCYENPEHNLWDK